MSEQKSMLERLAEKHGWPHKIHSRGYDAYLVDFQPLVDGLVDPIYRFPGGNSLVSECEWKDENNDKSSK